MYQVKIFDGPADSYGITIHTANINGEKLTSGTIKTGINKIDSFDFSIHIANAGYGKIKPFKTLIEVFNTKTNQYEFEGRVLIPTADMDTAGDFATSFICESEMGYFHDAPQKYLEFRGSVEELLQVQLDVFNEQVEAYKRFELGQVTVTDPNDYMYLYLSAENSTYDSLHNTLIDRLGGEFRVRKENGIRYLDYLERIGEDSDVEIKLAKNLISISQKIDPSTVISRLTPLGTRIESEDESATDASQARLTIESVNNGKAYIDRPDLIALFGIQGGSMVWDDITIPANLKSRGTTWLSSQKTILNQYTLEAVDLFKIGLDTKELALGDTNPVRNPVMAIDERLRIVGKTINLLAPEKDTLTIGDKFKNANEYQSEMNKNAKKVIELQNRLSEQGRQLGNLSDQLSAAQTTLGNIQGSLQDVDIENLPIELQGISEQLSTLQTTLGDIEQAIDNIPIYGPASSTSDGLLTSELYMKLQSIQLATETIDGLMSKEDKQKVNKITVNQSIDLDQFMADFLALKDQVENM